MTDGPKLWDSKELARFMDVSERTVERMRTDGSGPAYVTIGRNVRYIPGKVRQWLDAQSKQITPERNPK